jgi:Domain of unknown function (DUF1877)
MGMVATLYQVTPQQLAEFLRLPAAAYDYTMSPFFEDAASVERAENMVAELRIKAEGLPSAVRAQVERVAGQLRSKSQASTSKGPQLLKPKPEPERRVFSLEKDWHVLHYALNGTHDGGTGPLADAILGGHEIPDVEGVTSFGAASSEPLRYLTSAEVQSIAAALLEVDPSQLLSKVNFADAQKKKIYLWHALDDMTNWDYLPDLFSTFRDFYSEAACSGNCMLLSIV